MASATVNTPDDIKVVTSTGEVVGTANWSETRVTGQSTGGGGQLIDGTGRIHAPTMTINSTVKERQRFFIREADGHERELEYAAVSVRDGHWLTAVCAGGKGSTWFPLVAMRNHTTRTDKLVDGNIATVTRAPSTQQLLIGLAAAAAPFVLSKVLDDVPILEFIGWIILPVVLCLYWRARQRHQALKAALMEQINTALASAPAQPAGG